MKHKHDNKALDIDDIFVWPDGTWCYRYELSEYSWKSDDYFVVFFGTEEYDEFFANIQK